ncbi:MAG: sulfur carrier protein ThiS [Terriglobales bacterium]
MQITFNGEARDVPEGLSVADLLRHLGLPAERLAVERNLALVPQREWESTRVGAGDRFEVVHFVGGGL